jgi:thioesterase domain-containing protein
MTKAPNSVTIIWATEGAQDTFIERCISEQNFLNQATLGQRSSLIEEKSRAAEISWCFESRANLGPQGWDRWISGDIHCERVEGNHFSVVMQPQGRNVSCLIRGISD